jgi:hypothetical protein
MHAGRLSDESPRASDGLAGCAVCECLNRHLKTSGLTLLLLCAQFELVAVTNSRNHTAWTSGGAYCRQHAKYEREAKFDESCHVTYEWKQLTAKRSGDHDYVLRVWLELFM